MNKFRGVAERPEPSARRGRPDRSSSRQDAAELSPEIARALCDVSAALQAVCDRVTEQCATLAAPVPPELLKAATEVSPGEDAAYLGTWIADAGGRMIRVGDALATIVGRPPEACLGLRWLEDVIEADRDATHAGWLRAVAEVRDWRGDYAVHDAHGGVRYIRSRGRPVRDAGGNLVGWVGQHLDITERRRSVMQVSSLVAELRKCVAEQTGRVWLMQDIAVATQQASGLIDLLRYGLSRIGEHLHAAAGRVYVEADDGRSLVPAEIEYIGGGADLNLDAWRSAHRRFQPGEGLVGRVLQQGEPAWLADLADLDAEAAADADAGDARQIARTGLHTALAVGVRAGGRVVAVLEFFFADRREVDEALLGLLGDIGAQLGHVAERKAWERDLAEALWRQQQRFGQDLHDGIGQELTGLAFLARSLQQRLQARDLPEAESGETVAEGIQNILGQVRSLAKGLFPVEVDGRGLMSALTDLAAQTQQRCGIPCRLTCDQAVRVEDNHVATQLFRIAQEAINNAVKHAQAGELTIDLAAGPRDLTLCVADDGVGIDPTRSGDAGIGLRVMRHRAELIRASLELRNRDAGGTLVICRARKEHHDECEQG